VESQPKSIGLVCGLAGTRRSVYIHQVNRVNSRNDFVHDDSIIKHCRGYYYYKYYPSNQGGSQGVTYSFIRPISLLLMTLHSIRISYVCLDNWPFYVFMLCKERRFQVRLFAQFFNLVDFSGDARSRRAQRVMQRRFNALFYCF